MNKDLDFLEPNDTMERDVLTDLSHLAQELVTTRKDINLIEESLKLAKELERKLSQEDIPNLLLQRGLMSITLDTGEKIEVAEDVTASLPKDFIKRKIVLRWLIKNGGGPLIKEELRVEEPEKALMQYLEEMDIPYENIRDVHHSTFKAFFRSKLGITKGSLQEIEVGDVPKEVNLFVFKKTKIK